MSSENLNQEKLRTSDFQPSDMKFQTKFCYWLANMKAMKIVVLIKISQLNYTLQEMVQNTHNFYLKTQKGQLHKQYQIINFIINQSRQNYCQRAQATSKNNDNMKDSDISHESQIQSQHQNQTNQNNDNSIINLCGQDNYIHSKMLQVLFELRSNLFPLLEQFYKYLLGHERVKKTKYQSLINKIKTEIAKLDNHMNQHSDIYSYQNSFLNIIIACELFMGCKFVFQEKFRKYKYSLFTKYQKISKKTQFQEIFGKTTLCIEQYVPPQFDVQQQKVTSSQKLPKKIQQVIPQDIYKLTEYVIAPSNQPQRNQLLYNYFRSVFTQNQHKHNYFHYFWLMFDTLKCDLIQIVNENTKDKKLDDLTSNLNMLHFQLEKYLKKQSVDYGVIGIYQTQSSNNPLLMRGVICLGSKSFENLQNDIQSSVQLRDWKIRKIDINEESQRKQVQNLWENTIQNNQYEGFVTYSILYI